MADGIEVGTAYVSIVPSAAGFGSTLESQITGQAAATGEKAGQALSAGVTASASGIARNITGIFAAIGVSGVLKGAVGEAEEAARVGNLTTAVIKSTGGAAGVSADEVAKLATSLSKVAGVDDEVIQSAENVMLTFRSVSGSVFPDAIKAALDMSAALGTDLQGSVIQLGKALNDPVQGMTALRRVGVSFTEDQVTQITNLQKSGDLLGAQQVILAELNKEFGGAAAAGATASGKLHVALVNLEEDLGKALLPAMDGAARGLNVLLGGFEALPGPVQTATSAIITIGAAATVFALIAPKLRQVRDEMSGLEVAGVNAGTAFTWLGRIGAGITIAGLAVEGANALGGALTRLTQGPPASLNKLTVAVAQFGQTGQVTGELAKQFGDNLSSLTDKASDFAASGFFATAGQDIAKVLNPALRDNLSDTKALDASLAGLVSSGHADLAAKAVTFFADQIRQGPGGDELANKFVAHLTQYQDALAGVKLQAQLSGGQVDIFGDAVAGSAEDAAAAAKKFDDLNSKLASLVQSDWSRQFASNLQTALNPLQKFTVGFGANVDDLKAQVASAKQEMDQATADVAKLGGDATTEEITRLRGQGAQLDDARTKVQQATAKWKDLSAQLAEAQKSPLTQLEDNLNANLKAVTTWSSDLTAIAAKLGGTAGDQLAHDLGALGPQAADAVHEALGLSPKQLSDLESTFGKRDQIINDAMSGKFELDVDQAAKPGEDLAQAIVDRYEQTLADGLPIAYQAAVDEATKRILALQAAPHVPGGGGEPGPGEAHAGEGLPPPVIPLGPLAPAPPPAGPAVPLGGGGGLSLNPQTGTFSFTTQVYVQTNADPQQIASTVGDTLAWRLAPRPLPVG